MKSRTIPTNWIFLCLFGFLIAIGAFTLSYLLFPIGVLDPKDTPPNTVLQEGAINNKSHAVFLTPTGEPVNSIDDLEHFNRFDDYFERSLALQLLIADADEKTLQQYLEESKKSKPDSLKEEVQDTIIQRIAVINPLSALKVVDELPAERRNALVSIIFLEWSMSNLDQAIEHAQTLDEKIRTHAIESIVRARDDLSVDELRTLARRLDGEWIALEVMAQNRTHNELIRDPEREWETFVQENGQRVHSFGVAQSRMFVFIVRSWLEKDGLEAVDTLLESVPQQWSLMQPWKAVLDELVETDTQLALNVAVRVKEITYRYLELAEHVVVRWAESNPRAALDATLAIEARTFRKRLHRRVMETWAEADPYALLTRVGNLAEDLQDLAREVSAIAIAKTSPRKAVEIVKQISDLDFHDVAIELIVAEWAKHDIVQTLEWIQSDQRVAHIQDSLKDRAFRELARHDPEFALETALSQSVNAGGEGMEAHVIEWLALSDLDTAVAMLPFARRGVTQFNAYDKVIVISLIHGDSERAIELFLQQAEKGEFNRDAWSLSHLVWEAPHRLFASLEKLRPGEWQAESARSLLRHHKDKETFTEDQLAYLQAIFDSQQKKRELSQQDIERLKKAREAVRDILDGDRP